MLKIRFSLTTALPLLLVLTGSTEAQLRKLNIAYTATSPYQAVLIIAKETGIFKKHGLEPTLILTPGGSPARPEDFVDMSFVKKLDDQGYFERLYKR